MVYSRVYKGTSLIMKRPPLQEHRRLLGIGSLYNLRGKRFLVSEIPVYI